MRTAAKKKQREQQPIPSCNGHNYHVWPFFSDRCVMCGISKAKAYPGTIKEN